jgi:hypothetical protein
MGVGFAADILILEREMQCMFNLTFRRVLATIVAVENSTYCVFWVSVFSLGIQNAMRMRHIVIGRLPLSTIFFHTVS